MVGSLLSRVDELKVFNTICQFTVDRSEAALKIAREADLLLVVGGRNSANTSRLRDTCREVLRDTYQIETCDEIDPNWLKGKCKIGVTAGASTPEWVISEVVNRLKGMVSEGTQRKIPGVFLYHNKD
jgi:(E)-4-hydroxy-3-methyl-but-2-enyl pyrophosphate reductase